MSRLTLRISQCRSLAYEEVSVTEEQKYQTYTYQSAFVEPVHIPHATHKRDIFIGQFQFILVWETGPLMINKGRSLSE